MVAEGAWWQNAKARSSSATKMGFFNFFCAVGYRCYLLLVGFAHGMSHGPSWCATLSQAQELAKTKDEEGGGDCS